MVVRFYILLEEVKYWEIKQKTFKYHGLNRKSQRKLENILN